MITFPDTRLQSEEWDCGRAVARTVLSLFGRTILKNDLTNPIQGLCPSAMEATIRLYGLPVISGRMRVEDLKHFTNGERPVMCPIADHGGHWVAVAGVVRNFVHYFDPTIGLTRRRVDRWVQSWLDSDTKGNVYSNWGIVCG